MKLATIQDGTADGRLVVVARDHEQVVVADGIARTLQEALDRWDSVLRLLQALYDDLNAGTAAKPVASAGVRFMAPLPRAWQWLDASAFPQHGILMSKAFDRAPVESEWPLMYQGIRIGSMVPLTTSPSLPKRTTSISKASSGSSRARSRWGRAVPRRLPQSDWPC